MPLTASPNLGTLRLAAGEAFVVQMSVDGGEGADQRSFVMSVYGPEREIVHVIDGVPADDDLFEFIRPGTWSEGLYGNPSLKVEIAERLKDGRAVIATPSLTIDPSAATVADYANSVIARTAVMITASFTPKGLVVASADTIKYDPGSASTPGASFTEQPTVSPASGVVGQVFTATPGVATVPVDRREWRAGGSVVGTNLESPPGTEGVLSYQEFAGSAASVVRNVTVAAVAVSTANFDYAAVSPGWALGVDDSTTAGRRFVHAVGDNSESTGSSWSGIIKGSDADLTFQSIYGTGPGLIYHSVDSGPFVETPYVGGVFKLMVGLPDVEHYVQFRVGAAYGDAGYMSGTGTVLAVTGRGPSVTPFASWQQTGDAKATNVQNWSLENETANYVPTKRPKRDQNVYANVSAITVRGDYTKISAYTYGRFVYLSKNGAAATVIDRGADNKNWMAASLFTGLTGTATYRVWGSSRGSATALGGILTAQAALTTEARRMDQWGDSITHAMAGTGSAGAGDVFIAAAALGYNAGNFGIDGQTLAQLGARITAGLAGKTVGANDVAIIAIGRNDGAYGATEVAQYEACIDQLLAAGYRRVLCRGVLPEGSNTYSAINGPIQTLVTNRANPKVKFINTSTWANIETADGVHPNVAGYVRIAGYAVPAYTTALA